MNGKKLDERQVAVRGRVAGWSTVVMGALVVLNGLAVDRWGMWGDGLQQASTILFLTATFACVWLIWDHAYYQRGDQPRWVLLVFGILSGLYAILLVRDVHEIWADRRAGNAWLALVMMIFFVSVLVTSGLRGWIDRRPAAADAD